MGLFQVSPMNFLDEAGKPAGIYIDLIEHIARKEGWLIVYVPGTWNEGLTKVKNGDIDLMPSIAFSKDRDKFIDFNHESVLTVWGEVYLRPDSGVQNILDLDGRTIVPDIHLHSAGLEDFLVAFLCPFKNALDIREPDNIREHALVLHSMRASLDHEVWSFIIIDPLEYQFTVLDIMPISFLDIA